MAFEIYKKTVRGGPYSVPAIIVAKEGYIRINRSLAALYEVKTGSRFNVLIDAESRLAAIAFVPKGLYRVTRSDVLTIVALRQAVHEKFGKPVPGTYPVMIKEVDGVKVNIVKFAFEGKA